MLRLEIVWAFYLKKLSSSSQWVKPHKEQATSCIDDFNLNETREKVITQRYDAFFRLVKGNQMASETFCYIWLSSSVSVWELLVKTNWCNFYDIIHRIMKVNIFVLTFSWVFVISISFKLLINQIKLAFFRDLSSLILFYQQCPCILSVLHSIQNKI